MLARVLYPCMHVSCTTVCAICSSALTTLLCSADIVSFGADWVSDTVLFRTFKSEFGPDKQVFSFFAALAVPRTSATGLSGTDHLI